MTADAFVSAASSEVRFVHTVGADINLKPPADQQFVRDCPSAAGLEDRATLALQTLEAIPQAVVSIDLEGRLLRANPAADLVLQDRTPGKTVAEVFVDDLVEIVSEVLAARADAPVADRPLSVCSGDGRCNQLTMSASRLDVDDSRHVGWVFVFRDNSLDVEVSHLRKFDALKSEFLLGLVHDMKTPLTGIVSGCDLLHESLQTTEPDQLEIVDIIRASAERLRLLALDLLDASSLESAALDEEMEEIDLVAISAAGVEYFILKAGKHRFRFDEPDRPIPLIGQRRGIGRVVHNLLDNAVKYSPYGGTIEVSLHRDAHVAILKVTDEGVGISASDLPHIWDRFRRGENHERIEGTGLGLSIIRMIVDKHNGRIDVESRQGQGSAFTVRLPI